MGMGCVRDTVGPGEEICKDWTSHGSAVGDGV